MANNSWDATIKQVYPADDGTRDFADTVPLGQAFDVVASVEVGRNLMQFIDGDELSVSVRNLSCSVVVATERKKRTLSPEDRSRAEDLTVDIPAGWKADVGDVFEVIASYEAKAGLHTDFSAARSAVFVVVPVA